MNMPEQSNALEEAYRLGDWYVYPQLNLLVCDEQRVHAEPKLMDVLSCLMQAQGRLVTRDELLQRVWPRVVVNEEVLTRAISELRSLLGDTSRERRYIATVPKRGYRLLQTAVSVADPARAATPDPSPGRLSGFWQRPYSGKLAAAVGLLTMLAVPLLWILPDAGQAPTTSRVYQEARLELFSELEILSEQLALQNYAEHSLPRQILLMPLVAITDDPQTQAFAAGLDQDLQHVLFEQTVLDIVTTSADTANDVDLILSGSVRIYDQQARISLQLVEAPGSRLLWSRSFECYLEDTLMAQAGIARSIGEAMASSYTA